MLSSWIAVSRFEALPLFTVVCLAACDVGISVPVLQATTRQQLGAVRMGCPNAPTALQPSLGVLRMLLRRGCSE